jgi:hypothetical protein
MTMIFWCLLSEQWNLYRHIKICKTNITCNVTCFPGKWRHKTFHFTVLFQTATFEMQRYLFSAYVTSFSAYHVSWIVKRYGKYGRKVSWIVKRYGNYGRKESWKVISFGKYGRKVNWIVKRYGKYGRKVSWIVKWYGKYERKVGWIVKWYGKYRRKVSWIVKW